MLPNTLPKRGELGVEVSTPEQTASGGGLGDDVQVLGEGVKSFGEGFGSEGGGGEVEAKDNKGRVEGKGRQNMVFSHHRPFQKTAKTGGGYDGRGASGGAVAIDEPKLGITGDTRRMVD